MRSTLTALMATGLSALCVGSSAVPALAGGTFTATHLFTGLADGAQPSAPVTFDSSGNYYGETEVGATVCADGRAGGQASAGCGTVYRMSPAGQLTTLFTFTGPNGANGMGQLSLRGQTLYGTAANGGADDFGVLFSVNTDGSDFTLIHQFNGTSGISPSGNLVPIPGGGFYGTTQEGGPDYGRSSGTHVDGELYEVTPDGHIVLLHAFDGADGYFPQGLLVDQSGTVYGATYFGGTGCHIGSGCGTIYAYSPKTKEFRTLYEFTGKSDGLGPSLGSIGPDGTLYGAAGAGGTYNQGTLFELTPSMGTYVFRSLHSFSYAEGGDPISGPTLLPTGQLFGTTYTGIYLFAGAPQGKLTIVYSFNTTPDLGQGPATQPILGPGGVAYGTAIDGGTAQCINAAGVVPAGGCGSLYTFMLQ